MKGQFLTDKLVAEFSAHLKNEEKSKNTTEKYLRDVRMFAAHFRGTEITKEMVIAYKSKLLAEHYAVRSVNSILASLNSLFTFLGWSDCKVKSTTNLLSRRKGADQGRISAAGKHRKAEGKGASEPHFADDLRDGYPSQRAGIHHGGSGKKRKGGCCAQRQNTVGFPCERAAKKIAPLCHRAEHFIGNNLHHP